MDAFEKWSKDYFNEHGFAPTPKESFRAGMRAAAEIAAVHWGVALNPNELRDAILAEADKP